MSDESKDRGSGEARRAQLLKSQQQEQTLVDQLEAVIKQAVGSANSFVVFEDEEDADHTMFLSNFEILHRVFGKVVAFSLSSQLEFTCSFTKDPDEVRKYSEQAALFFLDHCTGGSLQAKLRSRNGNKRMTLEQVITLLQRMCQGESPILDIIMELGDDLRQHQLVDAHAVTHWMHKVEYLGEWLAGTLGRYIVQNREELLRASQVEFGNAPSAPVPTRSEEDLVQERLDAWLELKENDENYVRGTWPTKDSDIAYLDEEDETVQSLILRNKEQGRLLEYRCEQIKIREVVRKELALADPPPSSQEAKHGAGESITRVQQRDAVVFLAGAKLTAYLNTPNGRPYEVGTTPTLSPIGWRWVYLKSTPRKYRWIYSETGVHDVNHPTAWGKIILQIVERENRLARREAKRKSAPQPVRQSGSSPSKGASKTKTQDKGPYGLERHFIKKKHTNDRYVELGRQQLWTLQLSLLVDDATSELNKPVINPKRKEVLERCLRNYKKEGQKRGIPPNLDWSASVDRGQRSGMGSFIQHGTGNHGSRKSSQSRFTAQSGSGKRGQGPRRQERRRDQSRREGKRRDESRGNGGRRDEPRQSRGGAGAGGGAGADRRPNTHTFNRGRRPSTPDSQRSGRRSSSRGVSPVDYSRGGSRSASGYVVQGTLSSTTSPTDTRRRRRLNRYETLDYDETSYDSQEHRQPRNDERIYSEHERTPTHSDTDHSYADYMSGYDGSQTTDDSE